MAAQQTCKTPWAHTIDEVAGALQSNTQHGLSETEAQRRLEQFGPNVLRESPKRSRLMAFLMQFADWMIGLLAAAALISALIGEWQDALLIAGIVLANGGIGFVQEQKAEHAVAALVKLSQPMARVWRGGKPQQISLADLVPGDLIALRAGDFVPADARLIASAELQVSEAPLTGESLPVEKDTSPLPETAALPDRANMVYAGTAVASGVGKALVTSAGMQTELGKIASLLGATESIQTPLQERLKKFGKQLGVAVVFVCIAVFLIGWLEGADSPEHLFLLAVSLAVAAIPEGLPAVITIALALGSQRMSRRNAIVRQLSAVETLGSVNVICTDKTGTLTQNKMTVSDWRAVGDDPKTVADLVRIAVLCNDAHISDEGQALGAATETALLASAQEQHHVDVKSLRQQWPRTREFPFESKRKRMSAIHRRPDGEQVVFVKGAAETLLDHCSHLVETDGRVPLNAANRQRLEQIVNDMAAQGRRVLAAAERTVSADSIPQTADEAERDLALVGFFGIVDPPRPEAKISIARCRTAGIRPVMITGDHQQTAVAIAKELSLWTDDSEVIDGQLLEHLSDDELRKSAPRTSVFARVSPEHKLRIVRAYQALGNVVSMTGDGVNDAPALKQADIGVAMGITGTDVSKQAARMVLADDNFASIVAAVEEGRRVYNNIRKVVQYLLTANLSEILLVLLAIVFKHPLPLLPAQLLWINLVTDGLPALALAYEQGDEELMRSQPRRRGESIFAGRLARNILVFGTLMGVACLGLFTHFLLNGPPFPTDLESLSYARTAVFVALAMFQLFYVLGLHSSERSILSAPPWKNWRLMGAVVAGTFLQIAIVYVPMLQSVFHTVPLRAVDLMVTMAFSTIVLVAFEISKPWQRTLRN